MSFSRLAFFPRTTTTPQLHLERHAARILSCETRQPFPARMCARCRASSVGFIVRRSLRIDCAFACFHPAAGSYIGTHVRTRVYTQSESACVVDRTGAVRKRLVLGIRGPSPSSTIKRRTKLRLTNSPLMPACAGRAGCALTSFCMQNAGTVENGDRGSIHVQGRNIICVDGRQLWVYGAARFGFLRRPPLDWRKGLRLETLAKLLKQDHRNKVISLTCEIDFAKYGFGLKMT